MLPEPEALGLLALMLLHESRRAARATADGEIILLDDQDRSLWNREQIAEGQALVSRAMAAGPVGGYTLQAAISAVHAEAPSAAATDWAQIVGLYDVLLQATASPVVELNRAVAIAMRDGPAAGLELIDAILARGELGRLPPGPRRPGRPVPPAGPGRPRPAPPTGRHWTLARQEPERRFLEQAAGRIGLKKFSGRCRSAPRPFD